MYVSTAVLSALMLSQLGNCAPTVTVFAAGEGGYSCIKIPNLILTRTNTLLAFGEARHQNCSDYAETDLVIKRSKDFGATWSNMTVRRLAITHTLASSH